MNIITNDELPRPLRTGAYERAAFTSLPRLTQTLIPAENVLAADGHGTGLGLTCLLCRQGMFRFQRTGKTNLFASRLLICADIQGLVSEC